MNDHLDEIALTVSVSTSYAGRKTIYEINLTGQSKEQLDDLWANAEAFIKREMGNSNQTGA